MIDIYDAATAIAMVSVGRFEPVGLDKMGMMAYERDGDDGQ